MRNANWRLFLEIFAGNCYLTKRRYLLLSKAKELIKGNTNIRSYVYSDINCFLALKFKDNPFKGAHSGLRSFLATESPLKVMENVFYFTSKALFVLKIFEFLSWLFGHVVAKRLDQKDNVNVKLYDVTAWLTNSCNTHIQCYITQYLER